MIAIAAIMEAVYRHIYLKQIEKTSTHNMALLRTHPTFNTVVKIYEKVNSGPTKGGQGDLRIPHTSHTIPYTTYITSPPITYLPINRTLSSPTCANFNFIDELLSPKETVDLLYISGRFDQKDDKDLQRQNIFLSL